MGGYARRGSRGAGRDMEMATVGRLSPVLDGAIVHLL